MVLQRRDIDYIISSVVSHGDIDVPGGIKQAIYTAMIENGVDEKFIPYVNEKIADILEVM